MIIQQPTLILPARTQITNLSAAQVSINGVLRRPLLVQANSSFTSEIVPTAPLRHKSVIINIQAVNEGFAPFTNTLPTLNIYLYNRYYGTYDAAIGGNAPQFTVPPPTAPAPISAFWESYSENFYMIITSTGGTYATGGPFWRVLSFFTGRD